MPLLSQRKPNWALLCAQNLHIARTKLSFQRMFDIPDSPILRKNFLICQFLESMESIIKFEVRHFLWCLTNHSPKYLHGQTQPPKIPIIWSQNQFSHVFLVDINLYLRRYAVFFNTHTQICLQKVRRTYRRKSKSLLRIQNLSGTAISFMKYEK